MTKISTNQEKTPQIDDFEPVETGEELTEAQLEENREIVGVMIGLLISKWTIPGEETEIEKKKRRARIRGK